MRIAIIGSGGIGGFFGAALIQEGHEVHFITTPRHVEAMRASGLRVIRDEGEVVVNPASVTGVAREVGAVDAVLVTVKLNQLRQAIAGIDALIGPGTVVIPLQNGVSAPGIVAEVVGGDRVVPGLVFIVTMVEAPGVIRQVGARSALTISTHSLAGSGDRQGAQGQKIVESLTRQGISARLDDDIDHALWVKFALITTFGGINVLAHSSIGPVREFPDTRALMVESLEEVRSVALAHGVDVSTGDIEGILSQLDSLAPDSTTSLQRDLEAGRPSELEELNGAVVRLAREVGVDVPVNRIVTAIMRLYAERGHV